MPELLLELFSEEIPARMQGRAADDLRRLVTGKLKDASLEFSDAEAFVTPRRLALVVRGLPEKQPDVVEEKRGPRVDAPDKAIQGFLNGNGLTLEQCERRETDKGTFWFAVAEVKGRATADVLIGLLQEAVGELAWPKSMRWGTGAMRWVRSLQSILCLFNGTVVEFELRNVVPVGDTTFGHRFHSPDEIEVSGFEDYLAKLLDAYVVLDAEDRRAIIAEHAAELAAAEGLTVRDDPGLLAEVAGLVEWPVVLMGTIDEAFMDVPPEVLITSMRTHQKYFSLLKKDGSLAPRFIVVANLEAGDGGKQIVAGNERVLRARLSDAKFFWDRDRKIGLEERVPELEQIIFHARLGTVAEKVARMRTLAAELSVFIPGCDRDLARRAALLAKVDLTAGMVGEFPELQGLMGRYYALEEGEKAEVADAIAEHYSPLGPEDACPTAPVSVAAALADKIDTLVGFFAIGEKPTGSKDPYALRRAALGVIRLMIENGLRLPLAEIFRSANVLYAERADVSREVDRTASELLDFFADRLKVHLREKGVRHDLINAVFALGGEDDLVRLLARVDALNGFLASEDGANLLTAHKRASNIVAIEEKKDGVSYAGAADAGLLSEGEEKSLYEKLEDARSRFAPVLTEERFDDAMSVLSGLRTPVDDFFDRVTVNCEDRELRSNRLRLLSEIRATMNQIADFSKIEG